jgi:hypothetical protein
VYEWQTIVDAVPVKKNPAALSNLGSGRSGGHTPSKDWSRASYVLNPGCFGTFQCVTAGYRSAKEVSNPSIVKTGAFLPKQRLSMSVMNVYMLLCATGDEQAWRDRFGEMRTHATSRIKPPFIVSKYST